MCPEGGRLWRLGVFSTILQLVLFQRSRDAPRQGPAAPPAPRGEEEAQAEEAGAAPQQLLHGREVPRLLQVRIFIEFTHGFNVKFISGLSALGTVLYVAVPPLDGDSGVKKDVKQYGLRGSLVLTMD